VDHTLSLHDALPIFRPGFEPGSSARKAGILDRTILSEPTFMGEHKQNAFSLE
jgi:hypothetical protein